MKKAIDADPSIKLVFLCSPGNPTGTLISLSAIRSLLEYENYKGIVAVDEAYVDFAGKGSAVSLVNDYANLVVMQTLSKSFGLAAIRYVVLCRWTLLQVYDSSRRLGIAIAQPPLIQVLTNTKAPYNISTPTAHLALAALSPNAIASMHDKINTLITARAALIKALSNLKPLGLGPVIGANHANFVMVPVLSKEGGKPDNVRAQKVYRDLAEKNGVVVRYRGGEVGCEGCLRITVGSDKEMKVVLEKLEAVLYRI
jgi:histidinol-phosphate aminotransferase